MIAEARTDGQRRYDPAYLGELRARTGLAAAIGKRVKLTRKGQEHVGLCPFHREKTPSFTVNEPKGFFHCFGCGAHGDVIGFVMRTESLGFREAVELLASGTGLEPRLMGAPLASDAGPRHDSERALEQRKRQDAALTIWKESLPAAGTLVERYLRARRITVPVPPALRFHSGLKHGPSGLVLPAMVAAVQASDGEMTAVHRTWLRPDGRGKAQVESCKMALGTLGRGAVRLGPDAPTMGLAEGIETALSAQELFGMPVWAALGCRLDAIEPLFGAAHLVVFRDNGAAGASAAERVQEVQRNQGRRITIKAPSDGLKDFNDVISAEGWAA
ncbi:MAG: CHC2 zinc finger domain-containing protein [Alphaproteobacteria bacterium]